MQGVLTIDLAALRENYQIIRKKLSKSTRMGAVVKANAYGLGAEKIAQVFAAEGCQDFFVFSLEEAVALRRSQKSQRIYVLSGFSGADADLYVENNIIPVLGSYTEIENYKKLASKNNRKLDAWLSFNIRMNRMGLAKAETIKLQQDKSILDGINITGISSHFACADEKDHAVTKTQHEIFEKIARDYSNAEKSLSNSSGIFRSEKYHYDVVRPGMALYGLNPTPEQKNPMQPVVSLKIPVVRTRLVYKGASVGYSGTYTFDKDTWIATASGGYADGISRSLSNKGIFYWNNYPCPIRGRVSMDLTALDLSAVPQNEYPKQGDFIEILGPHQDADALADSAGTIGYEVLTSLGQRYRREYIGG